MDNLIQKFSVFGVDLRAMEIYFDSSTNPIDVELFYDVVVGPYSQKIVLSKKQPNKKTERKPRKPKTTPEIQRPPEQPVFLHRSKNDAAVALGRLGGLKGGNARAEKLSPERRKEIAKAAAEKRWSKK